MIPRTLEPEVMESAEEAAEYDGMDHAGVNEAFVDDVLAAVQAAGWGGDGARPVAVLDVGTGTARIPIALARRGVSVRITALDLSDEMLTLARRNVEAAGLGSRIELAKGDGKRLPFGDAGFDIVLSNSIVHHIPDPAPALAEMLRVLRPGGLLFVRDLLRPETEAEVARLVETYAAGESDRSRGLFRDSLRAALTVDEVRGLLAGVGLPPGMASQSSDRHWTIAGVPQ